MEARATARFVRVTPRKARFVVDAVRGKHVQDALDILGFTPNSAAKAVEKVIRSAMANAENNLHISGDGMRIARAFVDEGPTLKRIQPRAMGRAYRILKRTSHISVVLEETETQPKRKPRREAAKPAKARRGRAAKAEAKPKGAEVPKAEKPKQEPVEEAKQEEQKTPEGGE